MHLIVFGEPNIILNSGTRNNALNEILFHYRKYNDRVTYVSYSEEGPVSFEHNRVGFFSIGNYSKNKRIILLNAKSLIQRVNLLLKQNDEDYHIQFRVPSLFAMQMYFILRKKIRSKSVSFYVAGNWKESLKYNYPKKRYLSYFLPKIENMMLRGHKCVFAGESLLNSHKRNKKNGFAFYSTTHTMEDIKLSFHKEFENGICFIGRIEKLKNYNFICSLSKTNIGRKYQFYMLGDGPDMSVLKERIDKEGLCNINLCGHVNTRDKFDEIVDKCKYFILPSYTEGTSKTLPEMMCRNTIPFAFKNVGSNNYIIYDNNGVLVDIDNVRQVEEFIEKIDSTPGLYKEYIIKGHRYAINNNIDNQLDKMFKFLYE
ncbi:glycosyltransferase [Citrobacter koseri]|uniref:glycosyltransferase n=1 Tax=Citrobacter koseri TaxID=545 RepID=UPI003891F87A